MMTHIPEFELRLARDAADIRDGQRLRYEVFVEELGAGGLLVDHEARLERDAFDDRYDHLLLWDRAAPGCPCVGVYRMMRGERLAPGERFYCEDEYDLGKLRASGRRLLELGRSAVHRDYRGGMALARIWRGLLDYVEEHRIEVLFGVASFHGTDPGAYAQTLSLLHRQHLAPEPLRVRARAEGFAAMDVLPEAEIDRVAAMRDVPPLLKAYLRIGGCVGEGAFVDRVFNTTDVCVVVDVARVPARVRAIYERVGRQ